MKKRAGFTLMEVLIAVAVLAIGVVGVVNMFPVGLQAVKRTADFTKIALLVQSAMEFYREEGYGYIDGLYEAVPLPSGSEKIPAVVGDLYYPAPEDLGDTDRGGGMANSKFFLDNDAYRWRLVISKIVDDGGVIEDTDGVIYKITLHVYWLDRGEEQWDYFETHIAKYEP